MAVRGGGGGSKRQESALTRAVTAVFAFVRAAEFEILFFLFFIIAFLLFKDLVSRDLSLSHIFSVFLLVNQLFTPVLPQISNLISVIMMLKVNDLKIPEFLSSC